MNKIKLELVPTFEEKLASFATAFVPELVSDIIRLKEEARDNAVIVHLLDQWYENNKRYESAYRASILDALQAGEAFAETTMTRVYKSKAFGAKEILMDYFMHNAFKK